MRQLKITKQVTNRETALEKLTKANLRFVVSVAKQYQNQGLTLPDLINEGNLGLIKAAQRFDETRGFKFISYASYAVWWIRQSILQALAEQSRIVRLPLNKIGSINKINKTFAFLEQAHERPPSAEEIAKELDMTINDVKALTMLRSL
jgi:RNA polymerase primary sigma factor